MTGSNGNASIRIRHLHKEKLRACNIGRNSGAENFNWKGDNAKKDAGRRRAQRWFKCPEGKERHHKDGNPLNNSPENIEFMTHKQHMRLQEHRDSHNNYV